MKDAITVYGNDNDNSFTFKIQISTKVKHGDRNNHSLAKIPSQK